MTEFDELFEATVFPGADVPEEIREQARGIRHEVWRSKDVSGPPVVLVHELDGLGEACRSLAIHLRNQGFRVHLPGFFGGLAPDSKLRGRIHTAKGMTKVCVRREFACIATKKTSPVSDWVRALAADIVRVDQQERGVGVIGMCLTGGIVLDTVAENAVGAAVAAQPSLPWSPETSRWPVNRAVRQHSLGMADDHLYDAIKSGTPVLTVRFDDDPKYPIERFELVERCFNAQVLRVPTTAVGERDRKKLHATLTGAFRSEGVYGQIEADSMAAVDEVVKFLRSHIGQRAAGGAGFGGRVKTVKTRPGPASGKS